MYEDLENNFDSDEMIEEASLEEIEEPLDGNPVLVKTYNGRNTGLSEINEDDEFETENLNKIYGDVLDSISEDEALETSQKIDRLKALREQYMSEVDEG